MISGTIGIILKAAKNSEKNRPMNIIQIKGLRPINKLGPTRSSENPIKTSPIYRTTVLGNLLHK